MGGGRTYRSQVRFDEYMSRRERDAGYGFRQHLKEIAAAAKYKAHNEPYDVRPECVSLVLYP